MKIYLPLAIAIIALTSCESHTYDEIEQSTPITETVTYDANVKTIIDNNCVVCHSSSGVASFRLLTTYDQVKQAIEETNLLERIQLQNGEDGLMPTTGRMSQGNIDIILQWNADGLLEN